MHLAMAVFGLWGERGGGNKSSAHHVLVVGMLGVHVSLQLLGGGEGLAAVAGEVVWRRDTQPGDWRTGAQPGPQHRRRQGTELVERSQSWT